MDAHLLDRILKCERLPSFPAIAARVIEMCGDDNISVRELGEVLSHDTAMSTKILRTINSSFYGLRHRVTTVDRATAMLGLNAVKMLALGFSLVPQLKGMGGEDFDPTDIWKRNLYSAVGAHTIARKVRFEHHDEAFIAGMLQDLGVIVLLQALRSEYVTILQQAIDHHPKLMPLENRELDLDHAVVGEALAKRWILPPILITAIRKHETPDDVEPEFQPLLRSIALGAKAADCFICPERRKASQVRQYIDLARTWFDLDTDAASACMEEIEDGTRELGKLFEISSSTQHSAADLMAMANETLSDLSVKAIQQSAKLEQQNQQLNDQVYLDPVTQSLNRGGLDMFMFSQLKDARDNQSPFSAIFVDVDKFKLINDTHGHGTGDRALQMIVSSMDGCGPEGARVGRYGGDEFVLAMPHTDAQQAALIAEKVRKKIEAQAVHTDEGAAVSVTVSVGIATFNGSAVDVPPETLIVSADKAMYAAKSAGGNKAYQSPPIDQPQSKAS